jgi:Mn2+/Fe2+ NRAMP family transporter
MHVAHHRRGFARRFLQHRRHGRGWLAALLVVLGPGMLAGLSDDDPAGVTTYSVLGADYDYTLLWVIPLSTMLLVAFHLLAIRLAMDTGEGFVAVLRTRYGKHMAWAAGALFVVANFGTICAEFAGIGAVAELAGLAKAPAIAVAAVVIVALIVGASFHRVERVLLALSALLASYVLAGVLAGPDWQAVGRGLAVPAVPHERNAVIVVAAALGTTLAPWGLAFIQSYAVDKQIRRSDYRAERFEVVLGSLLTGIIGVFIAVACAATLGRHGLHVNDAADAARALRPLAGDHAAQLFGIGLLGAGLLAAAIVPLATAYSLSEAFGLPGEIEDRLRDDRFFYGSFTALVAAAALLAALPGVSLVPVVLGSQLVNAVLLAPHLVLLVRLNRDPAVVGADRVLSRGLMLGASACIVLVLGSVVSLAVALLAG